MLLNCSEKEKCQALQDEELVEMTKKNSSCFVCLVSRYEEKLLRYIRRISSVQIETAEDILQEVFLKVYKNLNGFDRELKFSSWIYRIAHNETINFWRRNKKRKESDVSLDASETLKSVLADENDLEQRVYQKITNEQVRESIESLKEKYRTALILNYLEGKSYQEIADILKKPIGTVGTLISRAKLKLKEELKKTGVDNFVAHDETRG